MKNKFLTIFLLIITFICIFTVKTYASSSHIVYVEGSGKYHIEINFREELGLDIDNPNKYHHYFSSDIYYVFISNNSNLHILYTSEAPFILESNGLTNTSKTPIYRVTYSISNQSWNLENDNRVSLSNPIYSTATVYSSHDILNSEGEVVYQKYFSNNSEDSGNTGEGEDSGNTEDIEQQYYNFHGFDGIDYNLLSLPNEIKDYKHFVILKNSNDALILIPFNDSIRIKYVGDIYIYYSVDEEESIDFYSYNESGWTYENGVNYMSHKPTKIINSCLDLLQYADDFNSGEDFFYKPLQLEMQGVLAPKVQEVEMKGVLKEIITILPIILMTIVGLIGLRKALKMLSMVLRRS